MFAILGIISNYLLYLLHNWWMIKKSVLYATRCDLFGNCLAVDLRLLCSRASYAYERRPQKAKGHATPQPAQHTRVCFLAFFAQQTCQALEEHHSFTSHATFCCKNQWRKTPSFDVSYSLSVLSAFFGFMLPVY